MVADTAAMRTRWITNIDVYRLTRHPWLSHAGQSTGPIDVMQRLLPEDDDGG